MSSAPITSGGEPTTLATLELDLDGFERARAAGYSKRFSRDHLTGNARSGGNFRSPDVEGLAAEGGVGAGPRLKAACTIVDRFRGLGPIDPAVFLP